MTLDEMEAVARKAQEEHEEAGLRHWESWFDDVGYPVLPFVEKFSPDVVLKLLRVARAARGYERHEEHGAELCAALRALDL